MINPAIITVWSMAICSVLCNTIALKEFPHFSQAHISESAELLALVRCQLKVGNFTLFRSNDRAPTASFSPPTRQVLIYVNPESWLSPPSILSPRARGSPSAITPRGPLSSAVSRLLVGAYSARGYLFYTSVPLDIMSLYISRACF